MRDRAPGDPRRHLTVALVVALTVLAASFGPAGAIGSASAQSSGSGTAGTITSCTTIDSAGNYEITEDFNESGVTSGGECIDIESSSVVLDGNGHTIRDFDGDTVAISASGASDVTIRNVNLRGFGTGVILSDVTSGTVEEVSTSPVQARVEPDPFWGTAGNGIIVTGGSANVIRDNTLTHPGDETGSDSTSGNGIVLRETSDNEIRSNLISEPKNDGISLYGAHQNLIVGNTVTGDGNLYRASSSGIHVGVLRIWSGGPSPTRSDYNVIRNNDLLGRTSFGGTTNIGMAYGIRVSDGAGTEIEDNAVSLVYRDAIVINGPLDSSGIGTGIVANSVTDAGGSGIVVDEDGSEVRQNSLTRAGREDGDGVVVSANDSVVADSSISSVGGDGMSISGASNLTLSNNDIQGADDWTVRLEDTNTTVDLPTGNTDAESITAEGSDFAIRTVSHPDTATPDGKQDVGVFLEANATTQDAEMRLEVTYPDSAISSVDESTLRMWRYNQSWSLVDGSTTVYTGNNTVVGETTGFSLFAPLADNEPPSANLTASPTSASVGETVTFDASGSADPDGTIDEYRWDYDGDGSVEETTTDATTTHVYSTRGDYDANVTVVDDGGDADSANSTVTVAGVAAATGETWPQYGYDGRNTGYAPNNTGTGGEVVERWSHRTVGSTAAPLVIGDDVAYVSAGSASVYAIDTEDGTQEWEYSASGGSVEDLALRDGILYVATDFTITAVYADTGNEKWEREAAWQRVNQETGANSLAVTDDRVYADLTDGGIEAFHVPNGSLASFNGYGYSSYFYSPLAADNGTTYVAGDDDDGVVAAVDGDDGTVQWETVIGTAGFTSPAVRNGTVYVGQEDANNTFRALDAGTGEFAWNRTFDESLVEGPAIADGTVYVTSAGNVTALDATDGSTLWREAVDNPTTAPVVVDGTVYVGDGETGFSGGDGDLYALDANDGSLRWTHAVSSADPVIGNLAVVNGTVYAGDGGGRLHALTGRSVLGPADFEVSLARTNLPVAEGETLSVEATVENVGGYQGTQAVTLSVDGVQRNSEMLTVDAQDSETVELSWTPADGEAGTYTAAVESENDSASLGLTVDAEPASSPRQFNYCTVLDSPGVYELTSDVTDSSAPACIEITSSDVVLDGQGHLIDMGGSGDAASVSASDASNVTVENLTARNVNNGIEVEVTATTEVNDLRFRDNDIESSGDGIDVTVTADHSDVTVSGVRFRGNDISGSADGIAFEADGAGATFTDVGFVGNDIGVTDGDTDAILVDAGDDGQTVEVEFRDNTLEATVNGIALDADATGSAVTASATDNTIVGPTGASAVRQGVLVDAYDDEQVVDVEVRRNGITADWTGVDIEADGANGTLDAAITDNDVESDDGVILAADGDNVNADVGIERNQMNVEDQGLELEGDANGANVTLSVADNVVAGDDLSPGLDLTFGARSVTTDVAIHNNEIESGGLAIDLPEAPETVDVRIEYNEIHGGEFDPAIEIDGSSRAINATEIGYNVLTGDDYGVDNQNTTAGYVNATNNYWGASDGPSSAGPLEDPVTGALADGGGSEITERSGGVSNVHFDPWLSSAPNPEANFTVGVAGTNEPVTEGDALTVDARIENAGDGGTQTVTLSIDGVQRDSKTVTLGRNESTTATLTAETSSGDAGSYTATVESENASAATAVTVVQPSDVAFIVTIDSTNSPVVAGETLDVAATVENAGDSQATQPVTLSAGGIQRDSRSVTLGSGESTSLTLSWPSLSGDSGSYGTSVASENDTASTTVTIDASESETGTAITGTVGDATGDPLPGIWVSAEPAEQGTTVGPMTTGPDGSYTLDVSEGTYDVIATDPNGDYEDALEVGVRVSQGSTVARNLTMADAPDPGTIEGTVVNRSGAALGGATVEAIDSSFTNFNHTTADANGDFSMQVPAGTYEVTAEGVTGYASRTVDRVTVREGESTSLTLELPPKASVVGSVTGPSGPVTGAFVVADDTDSDRTYIYPVRSGGYSGGLPPGEYTVTVFGQGVSTTSKTVQLTASQEERVDFQLETVTIDHASVTVANPSGVDTANLSVVADVQLGIMTVQVQNDDTANPRGMPNDLEGLGVDRDTEFVINVTTTNYDPNSLVWGARDVSWSATENTSNPNATDITVRAKAVNLQGITSSSSVTVGPLMTKSPRDVTWPSGAADRADEGWNRTVYFGLFDLSTAPPEARQDLAGMSVTTNAQTFTPPSVSNNSLRVWVAGPAVTTEGEDHTGFYRATIPDAQLQEWGVTDPENDLTALYKGDTANFTITETADGARVLLENISYSAGVAEIGTGLEPVAGDEDDSDDTDDSTSDDDASDTSSSVSAPADDGPEPVRADLADDSSDQPGVQVSVDDGPVEALSFEDESLEGAGEVSVTQREASPTTVADEFGSESVVSSVDIQVPDAAEDASATIRFHFTASELGDRDPETLQVVRVVDGENQRLPTEVEEDSNDGYVVEADTPGFSTFAVVSVQQQTESVTDETPTATPETTPTTDEPAPTATETPTRTESPGGLDGFGVTVALVAIVVAGLYAHRRRR